MTQLDAGALSAFLDTHGLGSGPLRAQRIGDGASNLTYLVVRDGLRCVVRRPPPPPLPPSAHDVVREAHIQLALAEAGGPVAVVLAVCEDPDVLGVPFYVMEELDGLVITDSLPAALDTVAAREALGHVVVDGLAQLHAIDVTVPAFRRIGRPGGYLERQLRRWSQLWAANATRSINAFDAVASELHAGMPDDSESRLVHGDFRLGNLMVGRTPPPELLAILDWEMATIGDPLADLGYLTATWSEPGATEHPLHLSPVTARPGFPSGAELAARYADRTARDVSRLAWYEALALWKAAVFCEAIYGRFLAGERDDAWAGSLRDGVPLLITLAAGRL